MIEPQQSAVIEMELLDSDKYVFFNFCKSKFQATVHVANKKFQEILYLIKKEIQHYNAHILRK